MAKKTKRAKVGGGDPGNAGGNAGAPAALPMPDLSSQQKVLGQDIGLTKSTDLKEQLDSLREQFVRTMGKQRGHMDRYKALQSLNKQLSESYFKNLQVIVDVSRLLQAYVEFLDIVRNQTSQIQVDMDKIGPGDFEYIRNLTTEKIYMLADEFRKSTSDLKTLYNQYNMKDELTKVEVAEQQLEQTVRQADDAYSKLADGVLTSPRISPEQLAAAPLPASPPPAPAFAPASPGKGIPAPGAGSRPNSTKGREPLAPAFVPSISSQPAASDPGRKPRPGNAASGKRGGPVRGNANRGRGNANSSSGNSGGRGNAGGYRVRPNKFGKEALKQQ